VKKLAGVDAREESYDLVTICRGCESYVIDDILTSEKLLVCPRISCDTKRTFYGRRRQMIIANVRLFFQRLWADPEMAEALHYVII
jgi:hypothetical protein